MKTVANATLQPFFGLVLCGALIVSTPASRLDAQEPIMAESVLLRIIDQVDVPASAAGVLTEINVTEGQSVKAGQLVGKIDDFESDLLLQRAELELKLTKMQIQSDVSIRTAETELAFASQDYQRMKKASDSLPGSVSHSEVADLELKARQAMLGLEEAKRKLQLTKATQLVKENDVKSMLRRVEIRRLVAPFDGTVEQVLHKAGEWVEPGEKVVRVINLRRLRAEGFVNIRAVHGDMKGAPVEIMLNGKGEKGGSIDGKIVFVHAEIDPVNGRMRVWAEVDNKAGHLRPGMRARMTIYPIAADRNKP